MNVERWSGGDRVQNFHLVEGEFRKDLALMAVCPSIRDLLFCGSQVICMVTTRPPKTIVKPTALGPVANTDTKLLIYGLF